MTSRAGDEGERPPGPTGARPSLSIVVPALNCAQQLRECLQKLAAGGIAGCEVIVVDDGSTDETARVAVEGGATVLRKPRREGPAAARNDGVASCRGELVLFLDADVAAHPDTVARVRSAFASDASLDALFGSYDDRPTATNVFSRYRNLLHHFVHQSGREQASTFWSGCGAIRRSVFLDHGGFDAELFARPSIEDIELGMRLRRSGRRIRLAKDVQVTHLKRWTLGGMLRTDVWDRGVPWTLLVLRDGSVPDDLNLSWTQRLAAALSALLMLSLAAACWLEPVLLVPVLGLAGGLVAIDRWTTHRPHTGPVPVATAALAVVTLAATCVVAAQAGVPARVALAVAGSALLGVAAINARFYRLCARTQGATFPLLVVPLHLLYYACCLLALALGTCLHLARRRAQAADGAGAASNG